MARPHPALEEESRDVGIALPVGPEEDLHRAFELGPWRAGASRHAGELGHDGQAALFVQAGRGRGLGSGQTALSEFPDETNWKDSISTRKRRSEPGDDMRTSKLEEPRDGTTPKT